MRNRHRNSDETLRIVLLDSHKRKTLERNQICQHSRAVRIWLRSIDSTTSHSVRYQGLGDDDLDRRAPRPTNGELDKSEEGDTELVVAGSNASSQPCLPRQDVYCPKASQLPAGASGFMSSRPSSVRAYPPPEFYCRARGKPYQRDWSERY